MPDSSESDGARTLLGATAVSPTQIDLSWQASTDDVGVTGYRVYRGGGQIATIGATTSYSDTSVTAGNTYSYEVRALDGAGHVSGPSNTATRHDSGAEPGADALARGRRARAAVGSHDELRDVQPAHRRRRERRRGELPAVHRGWRDGQRPQRQAPRLQLQRHGRRPRRLHDRQLVERDDRQLEHAARSHERLHGRQGGDRREHAGSSTTSRRS